MGLYCMHAGGKKKVKVCFYTAQYPVRWIAQSVSHFTPWQTCSFRHQLGFSGKHSSHAAITCSVLPRPFLQGAAPCPFFKKLE